MLKKISLLVGLVVFLGFFLNTAFAQSPGGPGMSLIPKMYGEFKMPPVGTWVKYRDTYAKNGQSFELKYSVVGKESSGGTELYWYELEIFDPVKKDVMILKMLISGNPADKKNLKKMIIKKNKEQAKEMPDMMLQMVAPPEEKAAPQMKEIGKETLKTKAGEILCVHKQYNVDTKAGTQKVDVWNSAKIPIYGTAKMATEAKTTEVIGYGTGAVTGITEEPVKTSLPGAPTIPK
jgi:hypothetical protein